MKGMYRMSLSVSKNRIMYILLCICILLQNRFFHIINPSSTITLLLVAGILLLFMWSITVRAGGATKYLKRYIISVVLIVIIPQSIYAFSLGETMDGYIDVMRGPICLLLSIPVLVFMVKDGSIERVWNMVTTLTVISLSLLMINMFFLNNMGNSILPFDYFQAPDIKRGGWYRILLISDFLSTSAIYMFCKFIYEKRNNIKYFIAFIVCIISEIYIEQSRMIVMSIVAACIVVYAQSLKKNKKWFYFAAVIFVFVGVYGDWFSSFFSSFSVDNSGLGISTLTRFNEISYAFQLIKQHPLMGTGMVHDYYFIVNGEGLIYQFDHTDIGLLGCFTYIGIAGTLVYFIFPYIRCIKTLKKYEKYNRTDLNFKFMLGIFVYITVTAVTILITDNARIFAWPFILAFFEFCRNKLDGEYLNETK